MNIDIDSILAALSGLSPMWAAVAVVLAAILRSYGWLKVPTSFKTDPVADVNPLKDRLKDKVSEAYDAAVLDGFDEDDVYKLLLDRVREPVTEFDTVEDDE